MAALRLLPGARPPDSPAALPTCTTATSPARTGLKQRHAGGRLHTSDTDDEATRWPTACKRPVHAWMSLQTAGTWGAGATDAHL